MSASRRLALIAGLFSVLSFASSSLGYGVRYACWGPSYRVTYYYPVCSPAWSYAPVYVMPPARAYMPLAQPYPAQPYPAQPYPAQPYPAQPYPAPPSATKEPPLQSPVNRGPKISESRSAPPKESAPKEVFPKTQCKVGFWNLTGRDVTVLVEGKPHMLPRDRAITLDLGRKFVWQLNKGEPRNEIVPDDQSTKEIILRTEKRVD